MMSFGMPLNSSLYCATFCQGFSVLSMVNIDLWHAFNRSTQKELGSTIVIATCALSTPLHPLPHLGQELVLCNGLLLIHL